MSDTINLPDALKPLNELSYNFWFSWNPDLRDLFREIDHDLWRLKDRNPVAFLKNVEPEKLQKAANNADFTKKRHRGMLGRVTTPRANFNK